MGTEESLRVLMTKLGLAMAAANEGMWETTVDQSDTVFDDVAVAMIGYTRDEVEPTLPWWTAQIHPDDREKAEQAMRDYVDGKADTYSEEYRIRHKDGHYIWVHSAAQMWLPDEEGALPHIVGIRRDITERKRAEEALRESEARYRQLFEHAALGIGYYTLDGVVVAYNEIAAATMGGRPEDFAGRSLFDIFDPGDAAEYLARVRAVALSGVGGQAYEDLVKTAQGKRWFRSTFAPMADAKGEVTGVQVVSDEISDRVRAERALRASEARYRLLFENAGWGIVYYTPDGRVITANRAAAEILGRRPTDLIDASALDLYGPETGGRMMREIRRVASTMRVEDFERELATPEGKRWIRTRSTAVPGPDGTVMGVLVISEDLTRQRLDEQSLRQSHRQLEDALQELHDAQDTLVHHERLSAIGQLAAGVAHDFNNILASITLYSEMAGRAPDMPEAYAKWMHTIGVEANRGAHLVQQILDFGRRTLLEQRPLALAPFLRESVALLERTLPEKIAVSLTWGDDDYEISADPTRIQQVIVNLALNARDAMPDGGQLAFSVSRTAPDTRVHCVLCKEVFAGEWVQVAVADTGTGISSDALGRIFEPFFTTRGPLGHGLGLAQVSGIVEQHRGHIDVATEVGKGTTFRIWLPALSVASRSAAADGPARAAVTSGQGQRVLVVEDNASTRQALVEAVDLLGYDVRGATGGRAALAILTAPDNGVSLVLCDHVMPEMDGSALVAMMEAREIAVPVIMVTGYALGSGLETATSGLVVGWIQKPVGLEELAEAIKGALER